MAPPCDRPRWPCRRSSTRWAPATRSQRLPGADAGRRARRCGVAGGERLRRARGLDGGRPHWPAGPPDPRCAALGCRRPRHDPQILTWPSVLARRTESRQTVLARMPVSHELLRLKLAEALASRARPQTQRDIREPRVPGKALAVIGVRRSGKTSYMAQRREARIARGRPAESQLLITLEDDRLVGMAAADLAWLLDEHARRFPGLAHERSLYLDEVQVVPGWEGVVRRYLDTGGIDIHVSGSSAKLLSREVATSLRGRALEVLVHPFSFREALRHARDEPTAAYDDL
ncbi:MAG: AAA family ATPase, partial [Chloroflexota bacterium]